MAKNPLEINLLGRRIVLKSGGDPELAAEVVRIVSDRINQAEKRARDQVPHHVALLALLDLAEAHVQAKRKVASHQKGVEEKSQELLTLLTTIESEK